MKKREFIIGATIAVFLFVAAGTLVWATAASVSGQFACNGNLINGWYWLRSIGHNATWTFNASELAGAKPGSVYVNMHALVTNGVNGGAGYGTTVKLKITGGGATQTLSVTLKNVFKPVDPANSNGLGYDCYGSAGPLQNKIWQGKGKITITVRYPFTPNYHVALNSGSVTLGFKK